MNIFKKTILTDFLDIFILFGNANADNDKNWN